MGMLMYVGGVHRNKYTCSDTVSILFDFIQIWNGSPISHTVPYYKILWSFNDLTLLPRNAITTLLLSLFYINPYPTAFPYGNGMVLHFYQQQESRTTKTVHKVINKGLKTYVQSLHTGENFH